MSRKAGIVGYGLSGRTFHLPLIRSLPVDFEVSAVAAGSRFEEAARELPEARIVRTAEELFRLPGLDLAVIASPSGLHAAHARAALEAGLAVVLEKPFASTVREAETLIRASEAAGLPLAVFHNRRWDADFRTLSGLLDRDALGEVSEAEFRWERFRPSVQDRWKERPGPGSGLLWDLGPHLFDQACRLFGPFDWVMADVAAQRPGTRVDDWFHAVLGSGKRRIILHAGCLAPDTGFHYRVHGAKATFRTFGEDGQEAVLRAGGLPGSPGWGTMPGAGLLSRPDGSEERMDLAGGDWREFYRGLAAALAGRGSLPVEPAGALETLRLMEAAKVSSETGRRVTLG